MSKFYVVSDEELERLRSKHKKASHIWDSGTQEDWLEAVEQEQQAEAACRVRVVPEWATHFIEGDPYGYQTEEIKHD